MKVGIDLRTGAISNSWSSMVHFLVSDSDVHLAGQAVLAHDLADGRHDILDRWPEGNKPATPSVDAVDIRVQDDCVEVVGAVALLRVNSIASVTPSRFLTETIAPDRTNSVNN